MSNSDITGDIRRERDDLIDKLCAAELIIRKISAITWRYSRGIGKSPEITIVSNELKEALGSYYVPPEGV